MADIPKIVEIMIRREGTILGASDDFIAALERNQNALLNDLIAWLTRAKLDGQKIRNIPANIQMTIRMRDQIRTWLRRNGYYEAITEFGRQYDELLKLSREYYRAMDLPHTFARRDLDTLAAFKKDDLAFMVNNDKRVINVIYNEVLSGVHQQRNFRDLAKRLENLIDDRKQGDQVLSGLLKKYNRTYAQTAIAAFDRRIQQIKNAELGLDRFFYSGGLLRDSRDFCVRRAGKTFDRKEVESWNGQSWQGKIPGCDVFVCLGGYNCIHSLNPTSLTDDENVALDKIYDEALKKAEAKRQK